MYFGMRRSGWRTPVPSHKSFCFRTGDPGFTSRVDGWALSWGFFCSSAFGLVCAAAGDWSLELLPGGGVWLNAVDAKNQKKKAQRRVIDLPLSPNGQHAVGRSLETRAVTRDTVNCSVGLIDGQRRSWQWVVGRSESGSETVIWPPDVAFGEGVMGHYR